MTNNNFEWAIYASEQLQSHFLAERLEDGVVVRVTGFDVNEEQITADGGTIKPYALGWEKFDVVNSDDKSIEDNFRDYMIGIMRLAIDGVTSIEGQIGRDRDADGKPARVIHVNPKTIEGFMSEKKYLDEEGRELDEVKFAEYCLEMDARGGSDCASYELINGTTCQDEKLFESVGGIDEYVKLIRNPESTHSDFYKPEHSKFLDT